MDAFINSEIKHVFTARSNVFRIAIMFVNSIELTASAGTRISAKFTTVAFISQKFKASGSFSRPSCEYSGIRHNTRCSRRIQRILSHTRGNYISLHEIRSATSRIVDFGDVIPVPKTSRASNGAKPRA